MTRKFRAPVATLLAGAMLCSGCAFRRHVAGMAIEHNDFVALTTNRQTVLNVLRAREREPMHFTSFQLVAGKVQGAAQLGMNPTFNGDFGSLAQTDARVARTNSSPLSETTVTDQLVDTMNRGATNFGLSPQISVTTGTDFQIAVNASEEFYRGILGPLSNGVIVHYLRQGFPPDLLSHLVIRRLHVRARIAMPDDREHIIELGDFENSPDDPAKIADFEAALRCWRLDYNLHSVPASTIAAPPLGDLSGVSAEVLSRLRRVEGEDGSVSYRLQIAPSRTDIDLTIGEIDYPPHGPDACTMRPSFREVVRAWATADERRRRAAGERIRIRTPRPAPPPGAQFMAQARSDQSTQGLLPVSQGVGGTGAETLVTRGNHFHDILPPGYSGELEFDIVIRSVEGILYYLGEYVRNESSRPLLRVSAPDPQDVRCLADQFCLPIIRIRPSSQVRGAERFVAVSYRGREYAVPMAGARLTSESGRSSQTISLVQQLLNLHRSSRDLPFTPLLRVQN